MTKKTVLITGSSKGIGKAIACRLLEEGYQVIGISRTNTFEHPHFHFIELDMNQIDTLPAAFQRLSKQFSSIDTIVCNTGRGLFGNLEEHSFAQISSLMNLNFLSHVFLIKAFLPQMKQRQQGDLIFIGSEASLQGKKKGAVYCGSKFALRGFTQALREECSSDHIRVSLINPGMVKTHFFEDLSFLPGEDISESIEPDDLAALISFILSSRRGTVFDEINLSPQKKRVCFKKKK